MRFALYLWIPLLTARVYSLILNARFERSDSFTASVTVLRGVASDISVSLIFGFLLAFLLNRRPKVFAAVWFLWALLASLNAEHILANGSNAYFGFINLAMSEQFITGSVLSTRTGLSVLVCLSTAIPLLLIVRNRLASHINLKKPYVILALGVLVFFLPVGNGYPNWIQMNYLETNTKRMLSRSEIGSTKNLDKTLYEKFYGQDLSGERILPLPEKSPNVLLVMVEGLNKGEVKPQKMPFMSALAEKSLIYDNFIASQAHTNRGLYSILCGDYPNLISTEAKPDLVASLGTSKPCLPELLGRKGYHSTFMQGARLDYMRKDRLMEQMGFHDIIGSTSYKQAYARSGWGVDDRALFEYMLEEIRELHSRRDPWFLCALTLGTHHPVIVPNNLNPTRQEALAYLDMAFADFYAELTRMGVTQDTMIIVTSDESHGASVGGIEGTLERNHIPLIIIPPGNELPRRISEPYAQTDVLLSLLDYLGFDAEGAMGKSLFRQYGKPRALAFGNIYQQNIYFMPGTDELYICSFDFECTAYPLGDNSSPFGIQLAAKTAAPDKFVRELKSFVRYNDSDSHNYLNAIYEEFGTEMQGTRNILASFPFSLKKGDRVRWELEVQARDYILLNLEAFEEAAQKKPIFVITEISIKGGDTYRFEREYVAPKDIPLIFNNFAVVTLPNAKYTVKKLVIRRTRETESQGPIL